MNRLNTDILQWIDRFSKAKTLDELDCYRRVTDSIMSMYLDENFLTIDEYCDLERRKVIAYRKRFSDICEAERCNEGLK